VQAVDVGVLAAAVRQQAPGGPLDRVEAALAVGAELASGADELIGQFVTEARQAGCSWTEIGQRMGVSKQAARQRFAHALACRTSPASSTVRGYAAHVRLYLAPHLGPILLAELTTAHVQAMFTAIIRQHQATGHPVTPATLARIRATLRAALNAAIRHGLITGNPARHVELPPARRPHAVVWTANRVAHWQATGERPRSRCGPPRRPPSSCTPSAATGCMPPFT
jgi:hypothetical protein